MRDSYTRFFKHFNIKIDDLIDFGLSDIIYPDCDIVTKYWDALKIRLLDDKKAYIRGFGRDAWGTFLFQEFYKITLKNKQIKKDSTNNSEPRKLLEEITGFSKTKKSNNVLNIMNYQVSHIFGKTKNPFMFTAPWNIAWVPKILDPFTGHESKGNYKDKFNKKFIRDVKIKYYSYIVDYNNLMNEYFNESKINSALISIEKYANGKGVNKRQIVQFKNKIKEELSIIPLDDANKELEVISSYLKDDKSHRWIQENILNLKAASRGGGFEAMKILHEYGIDGTKKGIFINNSISDELKISDGKYKEALRSLNKYWEID